MLLLPVIHQCMIASEFIFTGITGHHPILPHPLLAWLMTWGQLAVIHKNFPCGGLEVTLITIPLLAMLTLHVILLPSTEHGGQVTIFTPISR